LAAIPTKPATGGQDLFGRASNSLKLIQNFLFDFLPVDIALPVDTFLKASGESKARLFEVYGYAFLAHKPK
jgi:hypothetical protein